MAIPLPDARQLSDQVLDAFRLRAIPACELGFTELEVAQVLGVAHEAVRRWWTAYAAGGTDALPHDRSGRPTGSGRALAESQAGRVQALLDAHNPEQLGIPAPLWTRRAVGELIRRECGIDLAVRAVGAYLRRWGYTPKKPRRHARRQDPEEVRAWLEETYPGIEKRAAREGAAIYWCDEVGVAADAHPARGYARAGQPARMDVPDPHLRVNQVSAISNDGKLRFMTFTRAMTAAVMLEFLGRLLRGTTGKVFLILDRLSAHVDAQVGAWVAAHAERLEVFYLPRRAPERNPDEYLNNDLKGNAHAEGLPADKGEPRSQVQEFMRKLLHWPEHIKSYFQHPYVQYAAEP